jgi:hypothetical protein
MLAGCRSPWLNTLRGSLATREQASARRAPSEVAHPGKPGLITCERQNDSANAGVNFGPVLAVRGIAWSAARRFTKLASATGRTAGCARAAAKGIPGALADTVAAQASSTNSSEGAIPWSAASRCMATLFAQALRSSPCTRRTNSPVDVVTEYTAAPDRPTEMGRTSRTSPNRAAGKKLRGSRAMRPRGRRGFHDSAVTVKRRRSKDLPGPAAPRSGGGGRDWSAACA